MRLVLRGFQGLCLVSRMNRSFCLAGWTLESAERPGTKVLYRQAGIGRIGNRNPASAYKVGTLDSTELAGLPCAPWCARALWRSDRTRERQVELQQESCVRLPMLPNQKEHVALTGIWCAGPAFMAGQR